MQLRIKALLTGLRLAIKVWAEHLKIYSDYQLVVNQVKGTYQSKEPSMIRYVKKVKQLLKKLEHEGVKWEILEIPRSENSEAYMLAKSASEGNQVFKELELTEELIKPSIEEM